MERSRLIVASALMLLLVSSAWGQSPFFSPSDRTGQWEFDVQTRYTGSHDFRGEKGGSLSLEDNLGWGFSVGYNLSETFAVGGFVSWRSIDYDAKVVNADSLEQTFRYSGWLDTANIAFVGTWNVLAKRFTPYVQGSVGWAMADTNVPSDIDVNCWWDPWWGLICLEDVDTFTDDAASFAAGAGVSWQVTDLFLVRAGYEKGWIDTRDDMQDFDIVRVDIGFLHR